MDELGVHLFLDPATIVGDVQDRFHLDGRKLHGRTLFVLLLLLYRRGASSDLGLIP